MSAFLMPKGYKWETRLRDGTWETVLIKKGGGIMSDSVKESLKEGLRLALFGAVAYFVTLLAQYFAGLPQDNQTIVILTFVFRMADKYLHKSKKAEMGLSRF